jgi:hypothetical protein
MVPMPRLRISLPVKTETVAGVCCKVLDRRSAVITISPISSDLAAPGRDD